MKIDMIILLVINIILLIVSLYMFIKTDAKIRRNKKNIPVETFHTEPVVLKADVCIDYTMFNHMNEEDILGLVTERLAKDFGNAIVENPDLYFISDETNPIHMSKIYEAKIRIVPWK